MALKFPDILQHNNSSSYALIDSSEVRGTAYTITNLNQTGSAIPPDKRNAGMIVFVTSEQKYYGYYGATNSSANWNNVANWKALADGQNASNLNAITTGSSDTNQTISGSLTVLGNIIGSASFATSSISASFSNTASFTPNAFVSASVDVNTITFFKGDNTTASLSIDTGSGLTMQDLLDATDPGQLLYNFEDDSILGLSDIVYTDNVLKATGSFYGSFYGSPDNNLDADFQGTASYAVTAAYAESVASVSSSYPFNVIGNTVFFANANKRNGFEYSVSPENNFFVGNESAIRTIYSHSISIGYRSGFRETDYNGPESSSYGNIFLGQESGYTAENDYAKSSLFALYRSGRDSNAQNSVFLGREAGHKTKNSHDSILIGTKSGVLQQNASHSIFIGFKAASVHNYPNGDTTDISNDETFNILLDPNFRNRLLGSNNIVIGTNVSLPTTSSNSMNFGGILFGSGSYSTLTGFPLQSPVTNGRIGINIYPRNYNLEVSGSTNITDGLYVTNSINLTGSMNQIGNYLLTGSINTISGSNTFVGTTTITGSLNVSGSNTFIGSQSISGNLSITQDLTVLGTASFYTFTTVFVTSSIVVATGSNILGDTIDDIQSLVGTVNISGSLVVTGSANLTASNVDGGQDKYISVWTGNNKLTTGSIFESSSNILIGTTTNPNTDFKLYVSGNIGLPAFQISSIGASNPQNSAGIWRPNTNNGYTNFLEVTSSDQIHNFVFRGINGFNQKRNWQENNSSIVNINLGWGEPNQTQTTASTLLIEPHISKSNARPTLIRGIYYNPIITASANTTLVAIETSTGSIIFKNLPTNNTITNVLLYDNQSGELYYTASSGIIGGGGGGSMTGSNATGSFTTQSVWTFNHNLNNRYVLVQTYDTNWNQIIPENINLTDINTTTISFPTSESGYAIAMLGGDISLSDYLTNSQTSSMTAGTASYVNTLNQTLIISGNILPAGPYTSNTSSYSLGSATAAWKDIYVSNGSLIFISGSTSSSINLGPAGVLNFTGSLQGTASFAQTASATTAFDGVWTSYTPTWTSAGTQPSIGDGTLTGAYKQIGKTVFVRVRLAFGSSTSGGTGAWQFGLPVTASIAAGIQFPCSMLDNGNAWYQAVVNGEYAGDTWRSALIAQSAGGANSSQGVDATFPFAWGNGDSLQFNGSYESV